MAGRLRFCVATDRRSLAAVVAPGERRPRADAAAAGAKPEMVENCPGLVASGRPRVMPAALQRAPTPTRSGSPIPGTRPS